MKISNGIEPLIERKKKMKCNNLVVAKIRVAARILEAFRRGLSIWPKASKIG